MGNRFTYNFSLGSVRDTTRGARDALTNIQTGIDNRAALAEKKRLTDIQEARQAKADERADTLFGQQQDAYKTKLSDRAALNEVATEWTPQSANTYNIEPAVDKLGGAYDRANALAEARVKAEGLNADKGQGDQIGKIYDEELGKEGLDPSKNDQLQRAFESNVMSKEYATRQIMDRYKQAGGTNAADALALSKSMTGDLLTRDALQKQEVAKAAATNKARKEQAKNILDITKVENKATSDYNKSLHDSYISLSGKGGKRYSVSKNKNLSVMDAHALIDDSEVTGGFLFHADATQGKRAFDVLHKKYPDAPTGTLLNFMYSNTSPGFFDDTFNGTITDDKAGDKAMIDAFAKYKATSNYSGGGSKKTQAYTPDKISVDRAALRYSPVVAKTLAELDSEQLKGFNAKIDAIRGLTPSADVKDVKPKGKVSKDTLAKNPIVKAYNSTGSDPAVFKEFAKDPVKFGKEYVKLDPPSQKKVDNLFATDAYQELLAKRGTAATGKGSVVVHKGNTAKSSKEVLTKPEGGPKPSWITSRLTSLLDTDSKGRVASRAAVLGEHISKTYGVPEEIAKEAFVALKKKGKRDPSSNDILRYYSEHMSSPRNRKDPYLVNTIAASHPSFGKQNVEDARIAYIRDNKGKNPTVNELIDYISQHSNGNYGVSRY